MRAFVGRVESAQGGAWAPWAGPSGGGWGGVGALRLTGGWGTDQPPAPRWTPFYYDSFLLNAANTSTILRAKGGQAGFVYTQNSWVMHLFFHCNATSVRRRALTRDPDESGALIRTDRACQG